MAETISLTTLADGIDSVEMHSNGCKFYLVIVWSQFKHSAKPVFDNRGIVFQGTNAQKFSSRTSCPSFLEAH